MSKKYRHVLYVCCLTSFITITFAFGRYIFAVITPEIAKNLNLDYEFVGRINAFHQGCYLLFSLLGGFLSAIIGARLLISSSVILCTLSLVSLCFVYDKWILLIIVAIQGIFAATSWIPMVELAARSITEEIRGKSLGIISSGTSYGLILNGILIPYILINYNWQTVWLVFGIISFIIGLFGVYVVYSTKNNAPIPTADSGEIKIETSSVIITEDSSMNNHFKHKILLILLLIVSGLYLIPFQTYIVPFMQEDLGLDHKIAGISWGLFGIIGVGSGFLAGVLADKFSAKRAMIITYGISVAAILILVLFPNTTGVLLACGIFGLSYNGIFGLHPTYVSRILPPEKTAKLFGFLNLALGFGSMIGNYAGGYIKNASGSFINAYILMAILSLITLIICFGIRDDRNPGIKLSRENCCRSEV
ncbi:MAG: MFS transporter [Dehalobacterium sp.]